MSTFEFYDKATLVELAAVLKSHVVAIAGSEDLLSTCSDTPEHQAYTACSSVLDYLMDGQSCLFIHGLPAYELIDSNSSNRYVITPFLWRFMMAISFNDENLAVSLMDGSVTTYEFVPKAKAWRQISKEVPATTAN